MLRTLDVAISQLGIKEATGKNDGIPALRYMDGDKLPWCMGFLLWCNQGSDDPKLYKTIKEKFDLRNVKAFHKAMIQKGWAFEFDANKTTRKIPFIEPIPNDIIVFGTREGSDQASGNKFGHVGIIYEVMSVGKEYTPVTAYTIEGNYDNKVAKVFRDLTKPDISGYVRIGGFT